MPPVGVIRGGGVVLHLLHLDWIPSGLFFDIRPAGGIFGEKPKLELSEFSL